MIAYAESLEEILARHRAAEREHPRRAATAAEVIGWINKSVIKSEKARDKLYERRLQVQATRDFLYRSIGGMYDEINAARDSGHPESVIEAMLSLTWPLRRQLKSENAKLERIYASLQRHRANIVQLRVFGILDDEQALDHATWLRSHAGLKIPLQLPAK